MTDFYIYIITNKPNGVLYVGMTGSLTRRIKEHQNKVYIDSFSARYNLRLLVYYEGVDRYFDALKRERQIKKWNREWKVELIESKNPDWKDLSIPWLDQQ